VKRPKTLKAAKKRAWAAISAYIRQKHARNGIAYCVTCDTSMRWQDLHCGHFQHGLTYALGENGFYVLEENLHPQCAGCNTFRGGMLDKYTLHMIDTYGRETVEELQSLRHQPVKMKLDDYWAIESEYRERQK
jgi:hypothetical protein